MPHYRPICNGEKGKLRCRAVIESTVCTMVNGVCGAKPQPGSGAEPRRGAGQSPAKKILAVFRQNQAIFPVILINYKSFLCGSFLFIRNRCILSLWSWTMRPFCSKNVAGAGAPAL